MTATACIGEPISWLRLEQLALSELPAPDADAARVHLAACAACAAALERITTDARPLPRLPAVVAPARAPWWRRWQLGGLALGLAAAAAVIILVRKPDTASEAALPAHAARVKGAGVIVVTLVRDRADTITFDPTDVAPTDRWKVQLTCDPGGAAWVDVAVIQQGQTFFPLSATRITCGNAVAVPGAFRITDGGADLCVALGPTAPDRARLTAGERRGTVCTTLRATP